MPTSFNENILLETEKLDVNVYSEESKSLFIEKLESIKDSSIIGFLGEYGSGKSTFLEEIKRSDDHNIWIQFDARKYPDRKDLRDGFVFEFTNQLLPELIDDESVKVSRSEEQFQILLNFIGTLPGCSGIAKHAKEIFTPYTSGIKRILHFQVLLKGVLEYANIQQTSGSPKNISVVLEEVDRSGKDGIIFLETLKNFIDSHYKGKQGYCLLQKIVFICPIAEEERDNKKHQYLKVFDLCDSFNFYGKHNIEAFSHHLIESDKPYNEIITKAISHIRQGCKGNFRETKGILREIQSTYIVKKQNEASFDNDIFFCLYTLFTGYGQKRAGTLNQDSYIVGHNDWQLKQLKLLINIKNEYWTNDIDITRCSRILIKLGHTHDKTKKISITQDVGNSGKIDIFIPFGFY